MNRNYQKELEQLIEENAKEGMIKSLLLHSCCAPCSSYVLEYLSQYFKITVLYYNPNIYPDWEYEKRVKEQEAFIRKLSGKYSINFIKGEFDQESFYRIAKGYESEPEGGARCFRCYELRLRKTGELARKLKMDYFTTTLTVSPLKNAEKLNEIGQVLADSYGVEYLKSDFKKKNGYKRSIELSKEYGMYRQDYCGCFFSISEDKIKNIER